MARNRLTWQNVSAPDYGSAIRGAEAANKMFQDALGGLSTSLGDFATNRKNAQDEALLKLGDVAISLRSAICASGSSEAARNCL